MGQIQTVFVTISCDGPGCGNASTFEPTKEAQDEALHDYPWLLNHRNIALPDGRKFTYCSDECEAKSIGTGAHNKLEKAITAGNQANIALAAKAAERARQATEALKKGSGVTL